MSLWNNPEIKNPKNEYFKEITKCCSLHTAAEKKTDHVGIHYMIENMGGLRALHLYIYIYAFDPNQITFANYQLVNWINSR